MFTEARKIHLLEEVLKTTNESTLIELEGVLANSKKGGKPKEKKTSIYDLVGIMTKKETNTMKKVIADTCEIVNVDDWK